MPLHQSERDVPAPVEWVEERTPVNDFERVYLAPNTELFYLPYETFREKLGALAAAPAEVAVSAEVEA